MARRDPSRTSMWCAVDKLLSSESNFNRLTPAQTELLSLLAEECGELVQAIGKVLRHGMNSYHPDTKLINRVALEHEMGDVRAAMIMLCDAGMVSKVNVHAQADYKRERVGIYLHHAEVIRD